MYRYYGYPTYAYSTALTAVGASPNWECVNDFASVNDDIDYVRGVSDSAYATDLYMYPLPKSLGSIHKIYVYIRARVSSGSGYAKTAMVTSGTTYLGDEMTLGASYADYGTTYSVSPATGSDWSWGAIPSHVGVSLKGLNARCTAVEAVIDYTPSAGTISVTASKHSRIRHLLSSGQILNLSNGAVITRQEANPGEMVLGTAGAQVTGYGTLDGNNISAIPPISMTGTGCQVLGTSAAQKLTVKNGLGNGILLNSPKDCLCKWVKTENFNDGATEPLDRLGVGILLWGYGYGGDTTGNRITECEIYRSGQHGVQVCDVDGAQIDHNLIDGVDANFGVSAFGHGRTPSSINVHHNTIRNTRAEWVNVMNMGGNIYVVDNDCYNTRADFGICGYLCSAPTVAQIARNVLVNSNKEAIALNTCSGWLVEDNECSGMALGGDHHAAILLESSADGDCSNNIIQDNILIDNHGRVYFAVKEVDGGSHYCRTNQILNNDIYGFRALPVHLSPTSGSVQSGNGMD